MENIKDRAGRYKALTNDETFQEVIELVAQRQVDIFLNKGSTDEELSEARSIVIALKHIENVIQSVLDEESFFDKRQND